MRKRMVYIGFLLLATLCAQGQYYRQDQKFMLGINAGYTYPLGDMGKFFKNGMGANVSAKYLINRVIGIGLESGYHSFKTKIGKESQSTVQNYKNRLIPMVLETTFYIPTWDRRTLPYFGLHFGAYINSINVSQEKNTGGLAESHSKKLFLFSPGGGVDAGVLLELSDRVWLDLKIRADYIPKIEDEYHFSDDDLNTRNIGYNKMTNIGANIGLLYKF